MENLVEFLNSIFGEINNWKNINNTKLRNNKISINDAVKYRFNYSHIAQTKEKIKSSINFDNNTKFYRTSYDRKENNINKELYINLLNKIRNYYNKNFNKSKNLILSVDGTFNNTNLNKYDNKLETSLNMGYYDTINDIPYDLNFNGPNKKNTEIEQLRKYIELHNLNNVILVMDRAYFKYEFFEFLDKRNIKYVIRIKNNSYLLDKNLENMPKNYKNKNLIHEIRKNSKIIEYNFDTKKELISKNNKKINVYCKPKYSLITNLNNYSDEEIKKIYSSRWKVETFFKFLKNNFKFSNLVEKDKEQYEKIITINLILTYLCKIIKHLYFNLNKINKNKKITIITNPNLNEKNILEGIYEKILNNMIDGRLNLNLMNKFIESYAIITKNCYGRNFQRKCKCPFKKWYVKMYHDIYKYSKIKKEIDNDTIDKLDKNLKLKTKNVEIEIE